MALRRSITGTEIAFPENLDGRTRHGRGLIPKPLPSLSCRKRILDGWQRRGCSRSRSMSATLFRAKRTDQPRNFPRKRPDRVSHRHGTDGPPRSRASRSAPTGRGLIWRAPAAAHARGRRHCVDGDGFALPLADMQAAMPRQRRRARDDPSRTRPRRQACCAGGLQRQARPRATPRPPAPRLQRLVGHSPLRLTQGTLQETPRGFAAPASPGRSHAPCGRPDRLSAWGGLWIDDPAGLEARACECHRIIRREIDALLPRGAEPPKRPASLKVGGSSPY